jgi:hypothetical protein
VQLTYVSLTGTKVVGQAVALAPLTQLTTLYLEHTAVAGCAAFCAAVRVRVLSGAACEC